MRGHADFATWRRTRPSCGTPSIEGVAPSPSASPRIAPRSARCPSTAIPSYTIYLPVVRRWSTIRVAHRTYSVPSRLMGHTVEARVHADLVEVRYRGQLVETMPRLRGEDEHRIDYRHVIGWLVRKPGAFARYRYREDLFPSVTFRRAFDALQATHGERADVEYLRILQLAALHGEARVTDALRALLDAGRFDYAPCSSASPRRRRRFRRSNCRRRTCACTTRSWSECRHEPDAPSRHRRRSDHDAAHRVHADDRRARARLAVRRSRPAAGAPGVAGRPRARGRRAAGAPGHPSPPRLEAAARQDVRHAR